MYFIANGIVTLVQYREHHTYVDMRHSIGARYWNLHRNRSSWCVRFSYLEEALLMNAFLFYKRVTDQPSFTFLQFKLAVLPVICTQRAATDIRAPGRNVVTTLVLPILRSGPQGRCAAAGCDRRPRTVCTCDTHRGERNACEGVCTT